MNSTTLARYLLTMFVAVQFVTEGSSAGATENSLLWEIKSPNGAISHVFGTIHVADSNVFYQRDTVLALLDNAKGFYAEIDLDSMMQMQNPSIMMLPAGQTLASFYSDEEMIEIRAALSQRFGPMSTALESFKPATVAVMMAVEETENSVQLSVDQFLWIRATEVGCPRFGIEYVSEQLALLDSMPPSMLLDVVRGTDMGPSVQVLMTAYAEERLSDIAELIDSVSIVESFMRQLNDDRNSTMVKRLLPVLSKGQAFIAIGTAHLAGKQGLLEGLRRAGCHVKAITAGNRVQWLNAPLPTLRQ